MPFAMTHLSIAWNILRATPQIERPGDFLLGAVAPDAVHYRAQYVSQMKKDSHLCLGPEPWGRLTNNREWQANVLAFLQANRQRKNRDFLQGYCSHILADIQNNIEIWGPFLQANGGAIREGLGSGYHRESAEMDRALYLTHPDREAIWMLLEGASACDLPGLVSREEIERMEDALLHSNYAGVQSADVSAHRYVTQAVMERFIATASQSIRALLFHSETH